MGAHGSNGPESVRERSIDFPVDELGEELRTKVEENLKHRPVCDLVKLAGAAWQVCSVARTASASSPTVTSRLNSD
jgi:hypothetical protein